jgi:hypothetical protein
MLSRRENTQPRRRRLNLEAFRSVTQQAAGNLA